MKLFLCGPQIGDKLNIEVFREAQENIRAFNIGEPVIPHDLFEGIDLDKQNIQDAFRIEVLELITCNAIVMIGEWMKSERCTFFKRMAEFSGIPVKFYDKFIQEHSKQAE